MSYVFCLGVFQIFYVDFGPLQRWKNCYTKADFGGKISFYFIFIFSHHPYESINFYSAGFLSF